MLPQAVRACIVGDYQNVFDELLPDTVPDAALMAEAKESSNAHYAKALTERARALGGVKALAAHKQWQENTQRSLMHSDNIVLSKIDPSNLISEVPGLYNGLSFNTKSVELMACLPDVWKLPQEPVAPVRVDYSS
ncbi:uncharacterized protein LTR77_001236 [Saxophila tyrrhenica]|uniref:Uncharacterized protein n=1 Tax=Saxophila tyrrhenica TaxID=1690608 RepID=A0AAV9PMQ6_9PEZI|nr:hypothetical protein LTR77_001236 [Saxophila tyrrhenica]